MHTGEWVFIWGGGAKEPVSRYAEVKETKCCTTQGNQGFYTDNTKKGLFDIKTLEGLLQ